LFEHEPFEYIQEFKSLGVSDIIRLNDPSNYDGCEFTMYGFQHHENVFQDCTIPTVQVIKKFLDVCDQAIGAVAVHCLAGLGRTGTLISIYLMKHYGFTAREVIGYVRLMRPGSVIGPQQHLLECVERASWVGNTIVWDQGDRESIQYGGDASWFAQSSVLSGRDVAQAVRRAQGPNISQGHGAEKATSSTTKVKLGEYTRLCGGDAQ
jgi:hypothetical protein